MSLTQVSFSMIRGATFNVKDFGAVGDGTTDDAPAFQAAINAAQTARGGVFIPRPDTAGSAYIIKTPLVISSPIDFIGESMFGTVLIGVGLTAGQYVLELNNAVKQELLNVGNFTITGNDVCNCLLVNNTAQSTFKNIGLRNAVNGAVFTGTAGNNYGLTIENLAFIASISNATVLIPVGGAIGNSSFTGCYFGGSIGFLVFGAIAASSFVSCNFEGTTQEGLYCEGAAVGISFVNVRSENCGSTTADFYFRPTGSGNFVAGISFSGGYFSRGAAASVIRLDSGSGGGGCNGFSVKDCFARQTYTQMVFRNGTGDSGEISGNYMEGLSPTTVFCNPINIETSSVVVFNNVRFDTVTSTLTILNGITIRSGTWTPADASGAALTFTSATGTWTRVGSCVTFSGTVVYPATGSAAAASISGLPFASVANGAAAIGYSDVAALDFSLRVQATQVTPYKAAGASKPNSEFSAKTLEFAGSYFV